MFIIVGSLFASMVLGVVGQVLIKKGLNSLGSLNFASGLISSYSRIFFSPLVIFGLLLYFFGVFFWLYALSKVDLSYAFPFISFSYVLVVIFSWFFLGEHISVLRWIGVVTISLGVVLIARS